MRTPFARVSHGVHAYPRDRGDDGSKDLEGVQRRLDVEPKFLESQVALIANAGMNVEKKKRR